MATRRTDNQRRNRPPKAPTTGQGTASADTRKPTDAQGDAEADAALGTVVELEVTNVAHGGVFVARLDGRVVFVSDAIPGEVVRARISEARHGSFWRAETLETIHASPHRRDHVWSAASIQRDPSDRAGGAEFGHIELAHQRELKRQVITDALQRMAKLELSPVVESVGDDDDHNGLGWRSRVRLQVADDGTVGPYASRSHRVVDVSDLPLATERVQSAAPLGDKLAGEQAHVGNLQGVASIDVIAPSTGGEFVLPNERTRGRARAHVIRERVGEREFQLDARGFWQVHTAAPQTLTGAVQGAVDDAIFDPAAANLDLYGGVGLLAAAIGDRFGPTTKITSVESAEDATDFAAQNLADWIGAAVVTERVERFVSRIAEQASALERARQRAATVVLDPPRSGAGKQVVNGLLALQPAQIVYVACDPVAFARDAALFAAGGYSVRSLRAFDLFPHTHHVELVAQLQR